MRNPDSDPVKDAVMLPRLLAQHDPHQLDLVLPRRGLMQHCRGVGGEGREDSRSVESGLIWLLPLYPRLCPLPAHRLPSSSPNAMSSRQPSLLTERSSSGG